MKIAATPAVSRPTALVAHNRATANVHRFGAMHRTYCRPAGAVQLNRRGGLPAFGLYVRHARDVTLGNVQLLVDQPDARSALIVDDAVGLRVAGVTGSAALDRGPLVWLHDVHGGLVHASFQVESGGVFVRVTGGKTANVALVGAGLAEFGSEIGPDAVTRVVPAAQPG